MSIIHMGDIRLEIITQEMRFSICPVILDMYTFKLNSKQLQIKYLDYFSRFLNAHICCLT